MGERRTSAAPHASVVVPVRDRRDLLIRLLDGLEQQSYRDFEVIVVDDGSTDGSADEAARRSVAGRSVRVVHSGGRGAVAARTQGVAEARGTVLAFIDSDCVPTPCWLEGGVAAIDRGVDLANGPTRPARPPSPTERTLWSGREGLYPTCNLFVRRSAFDAAGGFDLEAAHRLGFRVDRRAKGLGFGEDTLLAWRVRRSGGAEFVPDAVVEHHVFAPDLFDTLSRAWMAAAFPRLVREVPELRENMLVAHRLQLGRRTRLPFYLALLFLVTGRRRAFAVSLAWWAAMRLRGMRGVAWPTRIRALPSRMAEDAVTGVALGVGSIRARSILL